LINVGRSVGFSQENKEYFTKSGNVIFYFHEKGENDLVERVVLGWSRLKWVVLNVERDMGGSPTNCTSYIALKNSDKG
jgi:hypothetical protein